jgi:predicted transcriptional regulator
MLEGPEADDPTVWKKDIRRALVHLSIEVIVAGRGATRRQPGTRLVYLIVLEATLSGSPISASKIALIANMQRTTVRRKLKSLEEEGIVRSSDRGWKIAEPHLCRPGLKVWISRLESVVRRTHETFEK